MRRSRIPHYREAAVVLALQRIRDIGRIVRMTLSNHLFEPFAKMIEGLPAKGILKTVELEYWRIERDLLDGRSNSIRDAISILGFSRFLMAVKFGVDISPSTLPVGHVPFYRKTVERLIEAGELPSNAKEQFDATFSTGFLKALAC